MKKSAFAIGLLGLALASSVFAVEGKKPVQGIPHLDHVFVIMMENSSYTQIMNNPNAPFINSLASTANLATNYFGIGHPSLTNYIELVGGSNFGDRSDQYPNWHSKVPCASNISANNGLGYVTYDTLSSTPLSTDVVGAVCPIAGTGTDAATPPTDSFNEIAAKTGLVLNNIDGTKSIPAWSNIDGKSIANQLVATGRSWKSYQESLPMVGANDVNVSDGYFTNLTDFTTMTPTLTPPLTSAGIVYQYAVKHNPFAYFQDVQEGTNPELSLANIVGFDGTNGLYADLATGNVPTFSFIAPNQCNDMHGRGNGTMYCNYNPIANGLQSGMNPALVQQGDQTVEKLITAIKSSSAWKEGKTAIVVLWDENDYSAAPNVNQVVTIVDTNYGKGGKTSGLYYNHFSLLKSIEAGLGLPCLNHACDPTVPVMSDLFEFQHEDQK